MRAVAVSFVICAFGVLAYFAVERVIALRALTAPPSPQAFVQATWTIYKHGPGHRIHVGEQGIACTECHTQGSAAAFDRPSPTVCGACHEDALTIEHAQVALDVHGKRAAQGAAVKTMTDCLTCHGFGPDPTQGAGDCMRCHTREKRDTPAVTIHAEQACTSCHDVHENRVQPIDCKDCHALQADHGGHTQPGAAQCLECHHAHAPARSALEKCVGCHGAPESARPVAASAAQHGHTCTGCHQPHAFSEQEVRPCTSCHTGSAALAGSGHQQCTACHEPHAAGDSVRAKNVCSSCHRSVALTHPAQVSDEKTCTGCHAPHPAHGAHGPAPCTECHRDVAQSELSAHAQGVACVRCHAPHDFTAPSHGHAACDSCHGQRIKELSQTGHARCEDCHSALPHGGLGSEIPCAQCHEQGASVHQGHARCVQCHDPHTGKQVQSCQGCHAQQATQLQAKHGKCQSCHEPHHATPSAEVASCSACHAASTLPALHQVTEHRACKSCHQAHPEAPPGQAATCRACHSDKADHQPEATQCNGCHPFEAPPARRTR